MEGNNGQSTSKRTYNRLDFTLAQEEQLIDFVKSNPALYNPKEPLYKNRMYRDRLWGEFGDSISKTGIDCNKKWVNIRDIYNRNKGKKLGTGSAAASKTRRNEVMSFLDEVVAVNRK